MGSQDPNPREDNYFDSRQLPTIFQAGELTQLDKYMLHVLVHETTCSR